MTNPTFPEVLDTLKKNGAITDEEAAKFTQSHAFFEEERPRILKEFQGQWVAALGRKIYNDSSLTSLEQQLDALPERRFSYIEQIIPTI